MLLMLHISLDIRQCTIDCAINSMSSTNRARNRAHRMVTQTTYVRN